MAWMPENYAYELVRRFKATGLPSNRKPDLSYGLTTLELLIVISIVSILAASSVPAVKSIVLYAFADASESKLARAFHFGRELAISSGKIVTLCPGRDKGCEGEWNDGLKIFIDVNGDAVLDAEDELLEYINFPKDVKISWKGSGGSNYLKFSPTGIARQFGRLHLCSTEGDLRFARAITINRQGRLRRYIDRNGDGIVEDTNGRHPDCQQPA